MKKIEVKLSVPVVAPLLDVIKQVVDVLQERLAVSVFPDMDDQEMKDEWRSDLLDTQRGELAALLALFDSAFFSTGAIAFDGSNAESIIRACAAVRLRLREQFLSEITDEMLEMGAENPDKLPKPARKAMMCYAFLATIEELIIEHLDTDILGGE